MRRVGAGIERGRGGSYNRGVGRSMADALNHAHDQPCMCFINASLVVALLGSMAVYRHFLLCFYCEQDDSMLHKRVSMRGSSLVASCMPYSLYHSACLGRGKGLRS